MNTSFMLSTESEFEGFSIKDTEESNKMYGKPQNVLCDYELDISVSESETSDSKDNGKSDKVNIDFYLNGVRVWKLFFLILFLKRLGPGH